MVTLGGQVPAAGCRRAASGAPAATPTMYPASATPLCTASSALPVPAATPSSTRLPVITLPKTLPRARNEAASTAPVVSVSSTNSESLMDACERIMA
jgi:hypothetical protein